MKKKNYFIEYDIKASECVTKLCNFANKDYYILYIKSVIIKKI